MNPWEMDDVSLAAAVTGKNPWEMDSAEIDQAIGASAKPAPAKKTTSQNPGPFVVQDPLLGALETVARTAFPRTSAAAERGMRFAPWQGVQDAASLPGRAAMGVLSALGSEGEGLADRFSASTARTGADYSRGNLIPNVLEDFARDPFSLLTLGASSALGKALSKAPSAMRAVGPESWKAWEDGINAMSRNAHGAREAMQVGGDFAINGFANGAGNFDPLGATLGAVGGAPGAAKTAKDAPAWARVQTPQGVVDDLYRAMKVKPTAHQANKDALSARALEEVMFRPSPYGAPIMDGVDDWQTLEERIAGRLHDIAQKETEALNGPEFATRVPSEFVFAQPVKARDRIPSQYGQTDREALEEQFRAPFYDVYSSVFAKTRPGERGDRSASDALYDLMVNGKFADGNYGDVPLSEAVAARKQLINAAKQRGKFSKADKKLSDQADAYTMSYQQMGDFIRANVPEGPGATAYREAQQDFARLLPWRSALDERINGPLSTNKRRDQTELGRIGLLGESTGLFKSMPEVVNIDNAWKLYNTAPKEFAKKEKLRTKGSQGLTSNEIGRALSQLLRVYGEDDRRAQEKR